MKPGVEPEPLKEELQQALMAEPEKVRMPSLQLYQADHQSDMPVPSILKSGSARSSRRVIKDEFCLTEDK